MGRKNKYNQTNKQSKKMNNNFKTSLDLNLRFLLYFLTSLMKPTTNHSLINSLEPAIKLLDLACFDLPRGGAGGSQKGWGLPTQYRYGKHVRKYILHSQLHYSLHI